MEIIGMKVTTYLAQLAALAYDSSLTECLLNGRAYNLYHEMIFEGFQRVTMMAMVSGRSGYMLAFATPSGRDVNRNGIDDSCDLSAFVTLPRNDEPSNNVVPMKQYHGTEWAIESDQDSSTTADGVISRNLPISHVAGVRDGRDSRMR